MAVKPITPQEAVERWIPDYAVEAINELIVKHSRRNDYPCRLGTHEISERATAKATRAGVMFKNLVFFAGYRSRIKDVYERAGWKVCVDEDDPRETHFVFTPKEN